MNSLYRAALRTAVRSSRFGVAVAVPRQHVAAFAVRAGKFSGLQPATTLSLLSRQFSQTPRVAEEEQSSSLSPQPETSAPETSAESSGTELFIRNMSYNVTDADLKNAFEQYGQITRAAVAHSSDGMSRGFGFVTFADPEHATAAIENSNETFWQGRQIGVTRATNKPSRTGGNRTSSYRLSEPTSCLFIGNVPYETTDVDLNEFFRRLEGVHEVRVAVDRNTGWPRGFAHIDFTSVEAAVAAQQELAGTTLGGRELRIDFAKTVKPRRNRFVESSGESSEPDF